MQCVEQFDESLLQSAEAFLSRVINSFEDLVKVPERGRIPVCVWKNEKFFRQSGWEMFQVVKENGQTSVL